MRCTHRYVMRPGEPVPGTNPETGEDIMAPTTEHFHPIKRQWEVCDGGVTPPTGNAGV